MYPPTTTSTIGITIKFGKSNIVLIVVFHIAMLFVCIICSLFFKSSSSSGDITPTADPIYETPGEIRSENFAMTDSSAYGVTLESKLPDVMSNNSAYNTVEVKQ